MKRYLCFIICFTIGINLQGQKVFSIPGQTSEFKHKSIIYNQWSILSSTINFAKSKGVSPYDFGKNTGNLIAPSWSIKNDFTGFGQGTIYYWESWRIPDEEAIYIIEETNEILVFKMPLYSMKEYFDYHNNAGVSFNEMMEYIKGLEERIGEYSGCTFNMKIEEEWSPCTTTWYPYVVINIKKNGLSGEPENSTPGKDNIIVKY